MGVNIKVKYKPGPIPENYEYHDENAAESFENNGLRWSLADGTRCGGYVGITMREPGEEYVGAGGQRAVLH